MLGFVEYCTTYARSKQPWKMLARLEMRFKIYTRNMISSRAISKVAAACNKQSVTLSSTQSVEHSQKEIHILAFYICLCIALCSRVVIKFTQPAIAGIEQQTGRRQSWYAQDGD